MPMTEDSLLCLGPHGLYRLVYFQWGDPDNDRVLLCVHGLTRRGRDFDALAQALEDTYRVICVDLPGRGQSDWLPVAAGYAPPTYLQGLVTLLGRLNVAEVHWLGVSLGGLLGMTLASMPKSPISRLVVDDIGGFVHKEALQRISTYVGTDPDFADLAGLEAYMREINTAYGPLTDAQWAKLAESGSRFDVATGRWKQHYDPKLAEPFKDGFSEDVALWPIWDAIPCPVLLLHGMLSDILTAETAQQMLERKPTAQLVSFEGVGHAPMLLDDTQISAVRDWLLSD